MKRTSGEKNRGKTRRAWARHDASYAGDAQYVITCGVGPLCPLAQKCAEYSAVLASGECAAKTIALPWRCSELRYYTMQREEWPFQRDDEMMC